MGRSAASVIALAVAFVVAAAFGSASASGPSAGSPRATALVTVFATLRGSAETSAGSPDARGRVQVSLNVAKGKACWSFELTGVPRALSAHVHKAPRGKDGPVVIPLGARYTKQGCVTAPQKSIRAVANNPAAYYVNVHTQRFLNGAARGQLRK